MTTDAQLTTKFDRIIDLEMAAQGSRAAEECRGAGVPDWRKAQQATSADADMARLTAAIDALSPEEMREFGEHRARLIEARKHA